LSGGSGAVALAWALSSLIFSLSFLMASLGYHRQGWNAAFLGALALTGAAIYSADAVNLPDIAGMMFIGAGLGLMLARALPERGLMTLMAGFAGLAGLSMLCAALAIWRNPNGFGLLRDDGGGITSGGLLWVAITVAAGGLTALLALAGMAPRKAGIERRAAMSALTGGLAGLSVAALGFTLQNAGLAVAGGLAGSAALTMWLRLYRARRRWKGLADPGSRA